MLETDPISAQGDAKKLKGYANSVYRVRIGDYRLFYSFRQRWVKLLSVCKRDERTYEIELPDVDASAPPPEESILEPQYEEAPTAGVRTASQPIPQAGSSPSTQKPSPITTALPFKLTEALLKQWKNPSDLLVPNY